MKPYFLSKYFSKVAKKKTWNLTILYINNLEFFGALYFVLFQVKQMLRTTRVAIYAGRTTVDLVPVINTSLVSAFSVPMIA